MPKAKQISSKTSTASTRRSNRLSAPRDTKPQTPSADAQEAKLPRIKLINSSKTAQGAVQSNQRADGRCVTSQSNSSKRQLPLTSDTPSPAVRTVSKRVMTGKLHNPAVRVLTGTTGTCRTASSYSLRRLSAQGARSSQPSGSSFGYKRDVVHPPLLDPLHIATSPTDSRSGCRSASGRQASAAAHRSSAEARACSDTLDDIYQHLPAFGEINTTVPNSPGMSRAPSSTLSPLHPQSPLSDTAYDQPESALRPLDNFARAQTDLYQRHSSDRVPTWSITAPPKADSHSPHQVIPLPVPFESLTHQLIDYAHRMQDEYQRLQLDKQALEQRVSRCEREIDDLRARLAVRQDGIR